MIIYQKHIFPPHFEVVVYSSEKLAEKKDKPFNETWPVIQVFFLREDFETYFLKGRNNFFQTLVLFIFYVQNNMSGYLGQMSFSSKQLKLVEVISKD